MSPKQANVSTATRHLNETRHTFVGWRSGFHHLASLHVRLWSKACPLPEHGGAAAWLTKVSWMPSRKLETLPWGKSSARLYSGVAASSFRKAAGGLRPGAPCAAPGHKTLIPFVRLVRTRLPAENPRHRWISRLRSVPDLPGLRDRSHGA